MSGWTPRDRGFTLLEVVVTLVIILLLLFGLVEAGHHFLTGYVSGEQKYSELREGGIVLDSLRIDLDAFVPDQTRPDLGVVATTSSLSFPRTGKPGLTVPVSYQYDAAAGLIRRQLGSETPANYGAGLIKVCKFAWRGLCRGPGGQLLPCVSPPAPPVYGPRLKRVYLELELTVAPADTHKELPWLVLKTHLFPVWANRKLTSIWKR